MSNENRNIKLDKKIENAYINSFSGIEGEVYYLMLIGSKILLSNKASRKIDIDIDRLFDEFVYFKYYSKMSRTYLLNFFMPLIFVSRGFENFCMQTVDMADKLCRFYGIENKKYEYVIDVFCYDKIIRSLISEKKDILEILNDIKEGLIEINPYQLNKSENVRFQMVKIKYIETLHRIIDNYEIEKSNCVYETEIPILYLLQCSFGYEYDEEKINNSGEKSVFNLISILLDSEKNHIEKDNIKYYNFVNAMAEYILKLRYAEIDSKKYNLKSSPRKFINMEAGDEFIDPILNKAQIISKEIIKEDGISKYFIQVSTKTGIYEFKYNIVAQN